MYYMWQYQLYTGFFTLLEASHCDMIATETVSNYRHCLSFPLLLLFLLLLLLVLVTVVG